MEQNSLARAKQNDTIRKRYREIIKALVDRQGAPLSGNKSELKNLLVCETYNFGHTADRRIRTLSPEELFRVCLYSLAFDLGNSQKIDPVKPLELYRCMPGVDNAVACVPEVEEEVYRVGEDIMNQHSVISTRARGIILGYSVRVSIENGIGSNDHSNENGYSDDCIDQDNEFSDKNNGNDDTNFIVISDSEDEDQLDGSQSDDNEYHAYFVKEEEYLF